MGRVFRVLDRQEDRTVALKVLKTHSAEDRRRFEREVRTLSRLQHENIVRLFDVGIAGDQIFFTMELLTGSTLDTLLRGPAPDKDRVRWILTAALEILAALELIHTSGVLHRDLKPANIMSAASGTPAIKLLDFGLARDRELTTRAPAQAGLLASGTPLYMAPERIAAPSTADERADLYSLGALLYHLLAGQPPFTSLGAILSRENRPRPLDELNRACPRAVSLVVAALLEREPHLRPASAREARGRILSALDPEHRESSVTPKLLAPTFVGRSSELGALRALISRAATGKGGSLQLVGERAVGKTWLLEQSGLKSWALVDFGLTHVSCTFQPQGALRQGLQGAFRDLLAIVKSDGDGASVEAALDPWGHVLLATLGIETHVLPHRRREDGDETPPTQLARECFLSAATQIVRTTAGIRPLLLVFEDLQHADELELDLLRRLIRLAAELPMAVVVTYRPEAVRDSQALSQWVSELDQATSPAPTVVGSLADHEVKDLTERSLHPHGAATPELVSFLAEHSHGQPLALARCLQSLWKADRLRREGDAWQLTEAPDTEDAAWEKGWLEQIAALEAMDLSIVAAAMVVGIPCEEGLVAEMVTAEAPADADAPTAPAEDFSARLQRLVRTGLLVQSAGWVSPSEDLRVDSPGGKLVTARLGLEAVRALHGRAGAALLQGYGNAAESHFFHIAQHFQRAGNGRKSLELYLAAARYMARVHANRRGVVAYQRALELCETREQKKAIAEELGELYSRVGNHSAALEYFRMAAKVKVSASLDTRLQDKIGRVLHRQGEYGEALALYSRCLKECGDDVEAQALFLQRIGALHGYLKEASTAREHLERSLKLYEKLGDFSQMAGVQFCLGIVEKSQHRLEPAIARFEEAMRQFETSGKLLDLAGTLNNLGNLYRTRGDDHKALECFQRCIETRERIGEKRGLAICLNNMASVHTYRGELSRSLASTEDALRIFEEIGDNKGVLVARGNLGELCHFRGQFARSRQLLRSNLQLAEETKLRWLFEETLCCFAALELDTGEYTASMDCARRCLKSVGDNKALDVRARTLGILAAAAIRVHRLEEAKDALAEAFDIATELKMKEKIGMLVSQQVRFHLERGEPHQALDAGRSFQAQFGAGMDKMGAALLHYELGRVYRDLGPDWADRTEKELYAALKDFEIMESPQHIAATRVEIALYWQLLGEERQANELLSLAEAEFRLLGAPARLEELAGLKGSLS
jgi:tetratricopeptide (TPR) repeat protein